MKKNSLINSAKLLKRNEMKAILAGSRLNPVPECLNECSSSSECHYQCPNCTGGKCQL